VFRSRLTRILLLAFLLVVFVLPASYGLITDWWWFREIGYEVVFTRALTTRVLLFLAGFIVIAWRLNAAYWKDVK